jgi:hypothetical protein
MFIDAALEIFLLYKNPKFFGSSRISGKQRKKEKAVKKG